MALSPESDDKSPKSRGKRARQREPEIETPTQLPVTPNHTEPEVPCFLSRQAKKPQEIIHSSPAERVSEKADSDTDSATEDISPPERICITKRKATEQRTPDKKVRLDRKDEAKTPSPQKSSDTEIQAEAVEKIEEPLAPAAPFSEATVVVVEAPTEEAEIKTEMPSLTREVQVRVEPLPGLCTIEDTSGVTDEELMPQIGPEALVCHEVDLDDPEEKEKPSEELIIREEKGPVCVPAQTQPSQPSSILPHSLAGAPQLSSPSSTPSPDESHSIKSESDATIEVDSVAESQEGLGENGSPHGFDASGSSSNSSISLQERDSKDRGWLEYVTSICLQLETFFNQFAFKNMLGLFSNFVVAVGQKRLLDCNIISPAKKQKRNQKRLSTASAAEKNGAGK